MKWLLVFIGGGAGSAGRYALSVLFRNSAVLFPWPTLIANIVACIILAALFFNHSKNNEYMWSLLAIGFCGGLSTFSAFSMETFQLFRDGQSLYAWMNIFISVAGCLICFYILSKFIGQV